MCVRGPGTGPTLRKRGAIESPSCRTFRVQKDVLKYITEVHGAHPEQGDSAGPLQTGFLNQETARKKEREVEPPGQGFSMSTLLTWG